MRRTEKSVLDFSRGDDQMLIDAVGSLENGLGWINVIPGIPSESIDDDPSLFSWLAGGRPRIAPLATWMPSIGGATSRGEFGVLHGRGRLYQDGLSALDLPPTWILRQDHARRGLLFDVPSYSSIELAGTMIRVVDKLASVTTTGRYVAEVFRRT